jgi:hypothetical protein
MTGPYNRDRANWARTAIDVFRDVCHGSMNDDGSPDIEEAVGDLIADLMHVCDQEKVDAFKCVKNGVSNYVAEVLDDPNGMTHSVEATVYAICRPYGSRKPWTTFEPKPKGDHQ